MSTSKTLSWRCIMPNPYFEVAHSYLQRPFCSLGRSLIISGIALLLFISCIRQKHAFPPACLVTLTVLFAYWAIHVKGQFTNAQASLTPGFRKVHGVVAIIVAIIFVIILPGVAAPLIGWQSLGFVSVSTLLFGILLWIILRPGYIFSLLLSAGLLFIGLKPIWTRIEPIFFGKEPIQAFIIMSIGVILSITGIIRLFLLNEEKPEYHLSFPPPFIDGRAKLWLDNRQVAGMIYHARHATDSYWSRIHRWGHSSLIVWFALYCAILMFLFHKLGESWSGVNTPSGITIAFATIIPIILVIIKLAFAEKRFLSRELMMPVRRDSYLKQVGMLFANILFTSWGVMIAVSIVDISTKAAKPGLEFLIYSVSYSLMIQIWLFGLAIWIISFRSSIMPFIIMFIAFIFSVRNIPALEGQVMFPWSSFILGALLACLGLLLTWRGYRRWLVADFD
jgi:hypothetical protein